MQPGAKQILLLQGTFEKKGRKTCSVFMTKVTGELFQI